MKIEDRMTYLQEQLNHALESGASIGEVAMYESTIAEMVRVNDWILEQSQTNNRVYFEDSGAKYMLFKNTTGMDFRFFAMKVKVVENGNIVDIYEVSTTKWKSGKWAKLYFEATLKEGHILRIDANSLEYQIMNSKSYC